MSKSSSRHFPVTVTQLPLTRRICHHTIAYRPGKASDALTGHYRQAHPATPGHPVPSHTQIAHRPQRPLPGSSQTARQDHATDPPAVTGRGQPTGRARAISAPARRGALLRRSTGLCTPGRSGAPDRLPAVLGNIRIWLIWK